MRCTSIVVVALQLALLSPASANSPRPALRRPSIERQASLLAASGNQAGSSQAATSGIVPTAFQIINNVAGAGILTLSAGMAAGIGWLPAIAVCIALGIISGFTFYLLGEACELTGTTTFKDLWAATLGESSSWVVDVCIGLMCLASCTIYSGILGDVFTPLLNVAGVPARFNTRSTNIIVLAAAVLAPLSLLEDLTKLAFTSMLGCLAVLYTVLFIARRALDGSYVSGPLLDALPKALAPSFAASSMWRLDANAFVLVSNLGLAFIAHYNAPAFYSSLTDATPRRFGLSVGLAFSCLTLLYMACMGLGYYTFGDAAASNIMLNYAQSDGLAVVARLATGFSILFGFPLAMFGLVTSARGLAETGAAAAGPESRLAAPLRAAAAPSGRRALVLSALAFVTVVAVLIADIGLIVGLSGAVLGAAIVYVIPAIIALRAGGAGGGAAANAMLYGLMPLGAVIGVLGVVMALK